MTDEYDSGKCPKCNFPITEWKCQTKCLNCGCIIYDCSDMV